MPILVVDSNYLRDDAFFAYLNGGKANRVVIPELIGMEMHKRNAVRSSLSSMGHLCRFPGQVAILRDTHEWHAQDIRSARVARSLTCREQTASLPSFCAELYDDPMPERFYSHLAMMEEKASMYEGDLMRASEHIGHLFKDITRKFSSAELSELRQRISFSSSTQQKLMDLVSHSTAQLYVDSTVPASERPRNLQEARNTFMFRYSLCMILLYTRWVNLGQQTATKSPRLLNDVVDMQNAAIGTFFGGVLSRDAKMKSVHVEARQILRRARAYVG